MIIPEFKIILFKGKKLKDDKHPIVLQVKVGTRDYRRISLGMSSTEKEWNATDCRFKDTTSKEHDNRELFDCETKARKFIEEDIEEMRTKRKPFDFNTFKSKFLGKYVKDTGIPNTLLGFLYWYCDDLLEKEKLGTRTGFTTLYTVLKSYKVKEALKLKDVDKFFLEDLEKKLIKRKNKHTGYQIKLSSVWSYFKNIKSLFNKSIYFEVNENYPFKNSANVSAP
jgi:hypothetical protein